jgi:3-deoxy-D-manno-octulosonic-acid transferase
VNDKDELGEQVLSLLRDRERREQMGTRARYVFDSERGSVGKVMKLVDTLLQE